MTRLCLAVCCMTLTIACDRESTPAPPVVGGPSVTERINGTERIGWDQPAADAVELQRIGYVMYVDGARTTLADVTCGATPAADGFPCTSKLPAMSAGTHTLELASFVDDDGVRESARSAPLHVTLTAETASLDRLSLGREDTPLRRDFVVGGLESPADLAFAPDGRLFVAEPSGLILIVRDGRPVGEPAASLTDTLGAGGRLLAIALDPQFQRTGFVFAIYTQPSRTGGTAFTLARFRGVADTLGDRAVLLDEIPAATSPAAALRFGPDGKLYAAFDDGGDPRRRKDAGSLNGKIVRLNADGTTPSDARGGTPVYADGLGAPIAIDWDPPTGTLWAADRTTGGSPFTFYRGTSVPGWDGRLIGIDTLRAAAGSRITAVALGPDEAIYYGTAGGVGRVAPERGP